MSCWHKTTLLRVPVSALGFEFLGQWHEFVRNHKGEFRWENGHFCGALCVDYPSQLNWKPAGSCEPDRPLDQRDPDHPAIVPGPFLDYYLEDIYPLQPKQNHYGYYDVSAPLSEDEMKAYLPEYQRLFPHLTLNDMKAVRWCRFEWYDGAEASYLYSEWQ